MIPLSKEQQWYDRVRGELIRMGCDDDLIAFFVQGMEYEPQESPVLAAQEQLEEYAALCYHYQKME